MTQISNQPTIKDFLLARIAEDEAAARDNEAAIIRSYGDATAALHSPIDQGGSGYDNSPVLVIDSARVLAECAAKRAIIATHDPDDYRTDPYASEPLLRTLAAVYSDHPDYQQEW